MSLSTIYLCVSVGVVCNNFPALDFFFLSLNQCCAAKISSSSQAGKFLIEGFYNDSPFIVFSQVALSFSASHY